MSIRSSVGQGRRSPLLPPQNATGNYVKVVQRVPVRIEFDVKPGGPDPRKYPLGPGMSVVPTVKVQIRWQRPPRRTAGRPSRSAAGKL